jgi:hypothetical protein
VKGVKGNKRRGNSERKRKGEGFVPSGASKMPHRQNLCVGKSRVHQLIILFHLQYTPFSFSFCIPFSHLLLPFTPFTLLHLTLLYLSTFRHFFFLLYFFVPFSFLLSCLSSPSLSPQFHPSPYSQFTLPFYPFLFLFFSFFKSTKRVCHFTL